MKGDIDARATAFLWRAAGSPDPLDTSGRAILARAPAERTCASCGAPARYRISEAISDNFTTVRNASRAWSFCGDAVCAACVWCCRSLGLRCSLFFARLADEHGAGGIWFVPLRPLPNWKMPRRPDPLGAILAPPPPPFVAGLPLYGIDHGGENNAHRVVWWDADGSRLPVPSRPLIKLQSKHTALYCRVSNNSERYHLQVDDALDVIVDVPLWKRLRVQATEFIAQLRDSGVGAKDARTALRTLSPPRRASPQLLGRWRELAQPFRRYQSAPWWGRVFVALIPVPRFEEKERHADES